MLSLIATMLQRNVRHYLLAWTTRAKRGPVDHQGSYANVQKKVQSGRNPASPTLAYIYF